MRSSAPGRSASPPRLRLSYYQIPFVVFEANAGLSTETKAGTTLIRTLEIWQRFGAASRILVQGDAGRRDRRHRARDQPQARCRQAASACATRRGFPSSSTCRSTTWSRRCATAWPARDFGKVHHRHRLTGFTQHADQVTLELDTPDGKKTFDASFLLACDGGRSTVRERLGVSVEGRSLPERFRAGRSQGRSRRREPARLSLSRLFQRRQGMDDPGAPAGVLALSLPGVRGAARITRSTSCATRPCISSATSQNAEVVGTNLFKIYHRVAGKWHHGRVVLLGDAAHLITPMWALGLNTGILDANNLAWRIAWVAARMGQRDAARRLRTRAEAGRRTGLRRDGRSRRAPTWQAASTDVKAMSGHAWGNAYTRSLLGVRLGLDGTGDWSMVKPFAEPPPVDRRRPRAGRRRA